MSTESLTVVDRSSEIAECFARLAREQLTQRPLSTYRLQFNKDFHFDDARKLVPYLHRLGISHCYASPILKARAGSTHGYDIVDHNQLNPEIGTEEEFRALVAELKSRGMGLILDTVPNHMGVGHGTNPWWQDVLQNGRASAYADFFDIDWEPLKPELRGKVLIPVLGNQYGEELEQGHIKIVFADGQFCVQYFDKSFPVDPQTIPFIFEPIGKSLAAGKFDGAQSELTKLLGQMKLLPGNNVLDPERAARRQREIPVLLEKLRRLAEDSSGVREIIGDALRTLNGIPGDARSFDDLHRLLEVQAYRLAFWRVSAEEINYRRFFDINDLVGLRMENPRVFAETHKLIRTMLGEGLVTGLRIDHPDGMLNPAQYFKRLQMLYSASQCCGPRPQPPIGENGIELDVKNAFSQHTWTKAKAPLYVVLEKILEPGEELTSEWPVDGTVGYEFTNLVNGILIDHRNEHHFTKLYHRIIDANLDVEQLIYESKKLIMHSSLSSEVNVLTHILDEISSQNRSARDFTRSVLRDAIRETIACFPVYRTYIDERGNVQEWDRRYIQQAIDRAKRRNGNMPPAVFDFLRSILLLEGNDGGPMMFGYRKQLYFSLKFQQLSGPVMAKGLEDTACYVYTRFISVNEVGGSPGEFGVPLGEFHRANQTRAERSPHSMLTTSTHDTKRSEDVRARLDVLSEMPRAWASEVMKWRRTNGARKSQLPDGRAVPDNNEEYLLYQTIVGAWPLHMNSHDQLDQFVQRMQQYMEKAIHEAKVNVSWINQNPDYIEAVNRFIARILSPTLRGRPSYFWQSLQKFLPPVIYFGAINSLTQTLLKLASPGVCDIYQGQEMFDFSLVDPDNRRPVDFGMRTYVLEELSAQSGSADNVSLCEQLLHDYRDGRIKFWVTMQALRFRDTNRQLMQSGSYVPLQVLHAKEEHVVAFARVMGEEIAIVAAPRLAYTLMKGHEQPPIGAAWGDVELVLPPEAAGRSLRDIFTGRILRPTDRNSLLCREVFRHFPVALLAGR
jgi:(1->4)-alpha-D-glucan 1-alpha-D-glucosylmutase